MSEKIAAERRAAEEMEQVRQELYLEEQEEKERQREAAAEAKRLHDVQEMQRVHKEQLYFKQLREEAEARELEEFRQQVSRQLLRRRRRESWRSSGSRLVANS